MYTAAPTKHRFGTLTHFASHFVTVWKSVSSPQVWFVSSLGGITYSYMQIEDSERNGDGPVIIRPRKWSTGQFKAVIRCDHWRIYLCLKCKTTKWAQIARDNIFVCQLQMLLHTQSTLQISNSTSKLKCILLFKYFSCYLLITLSGVVHCCDRPIVDIFKIRISKKYIKKCEFIVFSFLLLTNINFIFYWHDYAYEVQ